eukprot:2557663-Pleurochrysis_carterae.AAC.1
MLCSANRSSQVPTHFCLGLDDDPASEVLDWLRAKLVGDRLGRQQQVRVQLLAKDFGGALLQTRRADRTSLQQKLNREMLIEENRERTIVKENSERANSVSRSSTNSGSYAEGHCWSGLVKKAGKTQKPNQRSEHEIAETAAAMWVRRDAGRKVATPIRQMRGGGVDEAKAQ